MKRSLFVISGILAAAAPVAAQSLTGAGATFPNPIYTKWFDAYSKKTGIKINYQSIGSGGGIRQFTEGTVDFGASDGPMNESQIQAVNGNVLHVPTVLGAVAVTYNLPTLGDTKLKFDGNLLVDIFMGRVTKWNDAKIAALNPGVKLPDIDLIVVHRSDGSGTTYVFTDYLNKFSREWKDKVGYATSVNWPAGLGGKGNEGVTQQVKQTEGALGYVELIYAISEQPTVRPGEECHGQLYRSLAGDGDCCRRGCKAGERHRFSGVDHQCSWRSGVSDRLVHLAPGQKGQQGSRQGEAHPRLPGLDDHARSPGDGGRAALRAAAGSRGRPGTGAACRR